MVSRVSRTRRAYVASLKSIVESLGEQIAANAEATYVSPMALGRDAILAMMKAQVAESELVLEVLERLEDAVLQEVGEDEATREARDDELGVLIKGVRYARASLSQDAGEAKLKRFALQDAPPVQIGPAAMVRYARRAVEALKAAALTIEPRYSAAYTTADVAADLEPLIARVEALTVDVDNETRETQQARVERDKARARYEQIVYGAASIIEAFCRQAGMPEAAARVRPNTRRLSGRIDPEDDADDEAPAPAEA